MREYHNHYPAHFRVFSRPESQEGQKEGQEPETEGSRLWPLGRGALTGLEQTRRVRSLWLLIVSNQIPLFNVKL